MASLPNRATSYFGAAKAIISMPQHARPMGMGMSEFERAQLTTASTRVVRNPSWRTLSGPMEQWVGGWKKAEHQSNSRPPFLMS